MALAGLVEARKRADAFNHPVTRFEVRETHISYVLRTGTYAYKLKKPADLGFLDFSTLAKREHYRREELRLNRRLAPELYVDVVSEVAFLVIDLECRGHPALAHRFLNRYLEATGDYEGVRGLRHYLVYRAMVRSKVAHIRMGQRDGRTVSGRPHVIVSTGTWRWRNGIRRSTRVFRGSRL